MEFEHTPVNWENKGTEPTAAIKQSGFTAGYKPPAAYHNFLFANHSDCIEELQTKTNLISDKAHEHSNQSTLDTITSDDLIRWRDAAYQSESFFTSPEYVSIREIADDINSIRDSYANTGYLKDVDIKTITETGIYNVNISTCSGLPSTVTAANCGATLIVSKGLIQNNIPYANQYLIVNNLDLNNKMPDTRIYACQLYGNSYDYAWSLVASSNAVNQAKYSTTPIKIGEWIDGTPIWRIAFEKNFTEENLNAKSVGVGELISVKNANNAFTADYHISLFLGGPCIIDDVTLQLNACNIDFNGATGATLSTEDGVYGWIEFVTPESNLN